MPTSFDEVQRIDQLRAALLDLGLVWNTDYRLVDEGYQWVLDYLQPLPDNQFQLAQGSLARILDSH